MLPCNSSKVKFTPDCTKSYTENFSSSFALCRLAITKKDSPKAASDAITQNKRYRVRDFKETS